MSTDTPDAGGGVSVRAEDAEQTVLVLDGPGLNRVVTVNHQVAHDEFVAALREIRKEAEHLCQLNRRYWDGAGVDGGVYDE